jgi:hypothetical protein
MHSPLFSKGISSTAISRDGRILRNSQTGLSGNQEFPDTRKRGIEMIIFFAADVRG